MSKPIRPKFLYPYIIIAMAWGAIGLLSAITIPAAVPFVDLPSEMLVASMVVGISTGALHLLFGLGSLLAWRWTRILGLCISAFWTLYGALSVWVGITSEFWFAAPAGIVLIVACTIFFILASRDETRAYYEGTEVRFN